MAVGLSWISLDSLVRIETYQWVMGEIARKFFPPVSLALRGEKGGTAVEAMRKSRLFMGLAYSCFRFSATIVTSHATFGLRRRSVGEGTAIVSKGGNTTIRKTRAKSSSRSAPARLKPIDGGGLRQRCDIAAFMAATLCET